MLRLTLPVALLPVAMIESSFRTLLVAAIGLAVLLQPGVVAASEAAIALSPITTGTEKEQGAATARRTNPQKQNYFAVARHVYWRAQLDKSIHSVAPWMQFVCGDLTKVAPRNPVALTAGFPHFPPSKLHYSVRPVP